MLSLICRDNKRQNRALVFSTNSRNDKDAGHLRTCEYRLPTSLSVLSPLQVAQNRVRGRSLQRKELSGDRKAMQYDLLVWLINIALLLERG